MCPDVRAAGEVANGRQRRLGRWQDVMTIFTTETATVAYVFVDDLIGEWLGREGV